MAANSEDRSITNGTESTDEEVEEHEPSALQKHVMFFDINKDGIVYPWETFQGFRAIGCGIPLSTFASVFINVGLSSKTRPINYSHKLATDLDDNISLSVLHTGSLSPVLTVSSSVQIKTRMDPPMKGKGFSPKFPIEIKNIKRAKHGSDSGVYDTEGRFVPSKFEELFRKHAKTNANALTSDELKNLLKANREPKDYTGWVAAYSEWKILYILCKDKQGLLHKDTVRAVYDGSLFDRMAMERAGKKHHK